MDDPIEDGVSQGRIADDFVPAADWDLGGDQDGAAVVSVFDDLQEVATLIGADSDEAGRLYRFEGGHRSDLKPAMVPI